MTSDVKSFKNQHNNDIKKRDNNDIYNKLHKWITDNLELLTITSINNKINQLLQPIIEKNL